MNKQNISLGIELECECNGKVHKIPMGDYHSGKPIRHLRGWRAETDNSLRTSGEFGNYGYTIEMISPIFKTKTAFMNGLKRFQEKISKKGTYELNQVISFNSSCGSHIHFSRDNYLFNKLAIFDIFPEVRKFFFDKLSKSNIQSKEQILQHYNRSYASELTQCNFKQIRHSEFNFHSELQGKGMEWRSPNMLGIKTWTEFFEFWDIVYDTLKFLFVKASKFKQRINVNIFVGKESYLNKNDIFIKKLVKGKKSTRHIKIKIIKEPVEEIKCVI